LRSEDYYLLEEFNLTNYIGFLEKLRKNFIKFTTISDHVGTESCNDKKKI